MSELFERGWSCTSCYHQCRTREVVDLENSRSGHDENFYSTCQRAVEEIYGISLTNVECGLYCHKIRTGAVRIVVNLHMSRVRTQGHGKLAEHSKDQRKRVLSEPFDQGMGLRVVVVNAE